MCDVSHPGVRLVLLQRYIISVLAARVSDGNGSPILDSNTRKNTCIL